MKEIERIGTRVDELVHDMAEVKAEQKVQGKSLNDLSSNFEKHIDLIREHVTGDNKVISELAPLMVPLKKIVELESHKSMLKKQKEKKMKRLVTRFTLVSLVLGSLFTTMKIFEVL